MLRNFNSTITVICLSRFFSLFHFDCAQKRDFLANHVRTRVKFLSVVCFETALLADNCQAERRAFKGN
jgi:hypothetical protein